MTPRHPATAAVLGLAACLLALAAQAQITFYEDDNQRGRTFAIRGPVPDFRNTGFNDRASSVWVERGRWQVCEDRDYGGACVLLQPGNYPSLRAMGLNDRLSSARPASTMRANALPVPQPAPDGPYPWRRRPDEATYAAPVTWVHAVVDAPEQRCWIEHPAGAEPAQRPANVGRGLLGAVLGGVIGHQIGGGTGRDIATVGGAVAGGLIGANSGRGPEEARRELRRCENVASSVPAYWDVGYRFRGVDHQVQLHSAPGATVEVNLQGEPRQ